MTHQRAVLHRLANGQALYSISRGGGKNIKGSVFIHATGEYVLKTELTEEQQLENDVDRLKLKAFMASKKEMSDAEAVEVSEERKPAKRKPAAAEQVAEPTPKRAKVAAPVEKPTIEDDLDALLTDFKDDLDALLADFRKNVQVHIKNANAALVKQNRALRNSLRNFTEPDDDEE